MHTCWKLLYQCKQHLEHWKCSAVQSLWPGDLIIVNLWVMNTPQPLWRNSRHLVHIIINTLRQHEKRNTDMKTSMCFVLFISAFIFWLSLWSDPCSLYPWFLEFHQEHTNCHYVTSCPPSFGHGHTFFVSYSVCKNHARLNQSSKFKHWEVCWSSFKWHCRLENFPKNVSITLCQASPKLFSILCCSFCFVLASN